MYDEDEDDDDEVPARLRPACLAQIALTTAALLRAPSVYPSLLPPSPSLSVVPLVMSLVGGPVLL